MLTRCEPGLPAGFDKSAIVFLGLLSMTIVPAHSGAALARPANGGVFDSRADRWWIERFEALGVPAAGERSLTAPVAETAGQGQCAWSFSTNTSPHPEITGQHT